MAASEPAQLDTSPPSEMEVVKEILFIKIRWIRWTFVDPVQESWRNVNIGFKKFPEINLDKVKDFYSLP